jgi:hypothetical protein
MACDFNLNGSETFASIPLLKYNAGSKQHDFMKTTFPTKTWAAWAVAVAVILSGRSQAADAAAASVSVETDKTLPAGIPLGSPVGQVFKLVQAGVDISVIQTYISNCPTAFNLGADEIISLTDAGVSAEMISAMYAHDKTLPAAKPAETVASVATPDSPPPAVNSENPPPAPAATEDLDLNTVDQTLAPYGTWVEVVGYGRCWRPNVVVYDATWRPYCDRGRWVYTDCGWYWDSDYAWGVTFHYGRWFCDARYGWCWWPDRVWGPSWVTWRSNNEYCGWAPLPPFTVYHPGIGFTYRGNHVSFGFDFGLASSCFTFVSASHFCEPHPRYYCVPSAQVAQIYGRTTIVNNYGFHGRTIVNNGVSITVIGNAAHRPIQPVPVGTLVNPGRRGWHDRNFDNHPGRRFGADANDGSRHRQFAGANFQNTSPNDHHRGENFAASHPAQGGQMPDNRRGQPDAGLANRRMNSPSSPAPAMPSAWNQARNRWAANGDGSQQNPRAYAPLNISERPQTRPEIREPYRATMSRPAISAPAVAAAPPQISLPRQNVAPSAPSFTPRQGSFAGSPAQGWTMRNH